MGQQNDGKGGRPRCWDAHPLAQPPLIRKEGGEILLVFPSAANPNIIRAFAKAGPYVLTCSTLCQHKEVVPFPRNPPRGHGSRFSFTDFNAQGDPSRAITAENSLFETSSRKIGSCHATPNRIPLSEEASFPDLQSAKSAGP